MKYIANTLPTSHEADEMFRALASPTRRRILETLAQRPMRVTDLLEYVGVTQGTLSYHVNILHEAGLISQGLHSLQVDRFGMTRVHAYMSQVLEPRR